MSQRQYPNVTSERTRSDYHAVMEWKNFPSLWRGSMVKSVDFLHKRTMMRSFDVSFDISLRKLANKQSRGTAGKLTHLPVVPHICVAWSVPSHYLNQCWNTVNWTIGSKLQWNCNRYSYIFIQENAFENVVCEMASILSRSQCVKMFWWSVYFVAM